MPKVRQLPKRLDTSSELMHLAHAHWLAVGWLVAREAGIDAPPSPFGGQAMGKWDNAKNLPAMLKAYKSQGQLLYRIRRLCLLLHDHRNADICGGPEQWWQRILEEDILSEICNRLAPEVVPEVSGVPAPTRAVTCWWLRRGINPTNAQRRPATWALIEAVQGRCYTERLEVLHPSDDIPLPTAATNGVMSLTRRKTLLKDLTGSDSGWTLNHRIELTRDWLEVLSAWQLTAKETPTNNKSLTVAVDQVERYETVAVLIHNALMPSWWANQSAIFKTLDDTLQNKPSCTNGFGGVEKIEPKGLADTNSPSRMYLATKKESKPGANPLRPFQVANSPQRETNSLREPRPYRRTEP